LRCCPNSILSGIAYWQVRWLDFVISLMAMR
jgi:hypothetical protein